MKNSNSKMPKTFYEDACKIIDNIVIDIKLLGENPGDKNSFVRITLNIEILSGIFNLAALDILSNLLAEFKKAIVDICGKNNSFTEIIYDLSLNLLSKLRSMLTNKKLNDKQIENFINTYKPKIEILITSKRKTEKTEPKDSRIQGFKDSRIQGTEPSAISLQPSAFSNNQQPTTNNQDNSAVGSEQLPNYQITKLPNHHQPITLSTWDRDPYENLLETFVEETTEILTSLSKDLLELENNPENVDVLNLIFRNMHTLKGNSATVGLQVMNLIAHRAENILDKIRKKHFYLNSEIIDVMLEATDFFTEILSKVINRDNPNIDISKIVNTLDLITEGKRLSQEHIWCGTGMPVPYDSAATGSVSNTASGVTPSGATPKSEPLEESIEDSQKNKTTGGEPVVPTSDSAISKKIKTDTIEKIVDRKKEIATESEAKKKIEATSLRVDILKLDTVMNLVGEIVIAKIRISQKIKKLTELSNLIDKIIFTIEGGDTYDEICEIVIKDRMADYINKLMLDSDIYHLCIKEVENLKKIIESLKKKQPDYTLYESFVETENISGELRRIGSIFKGLTQELLFSVERLSLITNELQEGIIQMRMVPISQLFDKVPRIVRTLSKDLNKKAFLDLRGGETELDKTVIEKLSDPLTHLLRNSIDHGIESPEHRLSKGKLEEGKIILTAEHKGNQVVITIEDDGKGISDEIILKKAIASGLVDTERASGMQRSDILEMIFLPGFSTAEKVTDVSGRGVGMDVVLSNIKKLKGTIDIDSQVDKGTTITIRLPLTLAIIQVLLINCSNQIFAIPLTFVEEMIKIKNEEIMNIGPKSVFNLRGEIVSLVQLSDILGLKPTEDAVKDSCQVIIIKIAEKRIGFVIDNMIGQHEIVIKSLGNILKNIEHISGATILGEGNVVLILDILGIFAAAKKIVTASTPTKNLSSPLYAIPEKVEPNEIKKNILIVDDSKTMRSTISSNLMSSGYVVAEAIDGIDALEKAREKSFDLFTVDVMMPRMDGYELTKNLRKLPQYLKTPIIMVTSKSEKIDKLRGLDAGADEYVTKPFEKDNLLKIIRKFI